MKKLAVAFLLLSIVVFACKKNTDEKNDNVTSLSNLEADVDFQKILANDSILFNMMLNKSTTPSKKAKELLNISIETESDFKSYLDLRGYESSKVIELLQENLSLLINLDKKYSLNANNLKNEEFNDVYAKSFSNKMDQRSIKESLGSRKIQADSDSEATVCWDNFVKDWNKNAANYRKNAQGCAALWPSIIGTACVYLAGVTLDRQQEEAWDKYHACRFPTEEEPIDEPSLPDTP